MNNAHVTALLMLSDADLEAIVGGDKDPDPGDGYGDGRFTFGLDDDTDGLP